MTAFERHSYSGSAPDAVLSSAIDDTALSVTCDDLTGWPDGTGGNFVVIFEPGKAAEEKCLASARSGNTLTLVSRGMEGAASAHAATTTTVRHGYSARDADEANNAVSQTIGKIAAKGDLLVGSAANTLVKLGIGSTGKALVVSGGTLAYGVPTIAESDVTDLVDDLATLTSGKQDVPDTDYALGSIVTGTGDGTFDNLPVGADNTVLTADSTADNGVSWKAFAANWTDYTPTITDASGTEITYSNGTLSGRYAQAGKLVVASVYWKAGSSTGTGDATTGDAAHISLPVAPKTNSFATGEAQSLAASGSFFFENAVQSVTLEKGNTTATLWLRLAANTTPTPTETRLTISVVGGSSGSTGTGNWWQFTLTYEAA